eukprot:7089727-Ditylum_brightwellii.AAC.1
MDLDIGCIKNIDPLQTAVGQKGAMFPLTNPIGWSNNLMMSSVKHPFFRNLIHSLHSANQWYGSNYPTVLFSTGPAFVSLQYFTLSKVGQSQVFTLTPSLYCADNKVQFFYHMHGSTWHGTDAAYIMWFWQQQSMIQ